MSIKPQNSAALTYGQVLQSLVEAGKMASFTIHWDDEADPVPVSLRAAVWFLQHLEGIPESYDPEALASGVALQISYQYGTHKAVLGTYHICELGAFLRGRRDYLKRKYRDAVRAVRRKNLAIIAQVQKGGAAL